MAFVNITTVAVVTVICADHLDCLLVFADRIFAIEQLPVGSVTLVERRLNLRRAGQNVELESSVVRVIVRAASLVIVTPRVINVEIKLGIDIVTGRRIREQIF